VCPHVNCSRLNPLHLAQYDHAGSKSSRTDDDLTVGVSTSIPVADETREVRSTVVEQEAAISKENAPSPRNGGPLPNDSASVPSVDATSVNKPTASVGGWRGALLDVARSPQSHADAVKYADEDVVVMLDKFPKARTHLLVLPRRIRVDRVDQLRVEHLPILRRMIEVARKMIAELKALHAQRHFRLGFHAVPSMALVHLHLISDDFDSPQLTSKKHYNSFTTEFFLDADHVLTTIEREGRVVIKREEYEAILSRVGALAVAARTAQDVCAADGLFSLQGIVEEHAGCESALDFWLLRLFFERTN
jgi:diadenosine tetraphosphate (Ap4A) HIT family hydrolase